MNPAAATIPSARATATTSIATDSSSSADMLRISFLTPEDRQTGTYYRFHNLAIALRQLGHDVTIHSQTNESRRRRVRIERDGVPYVLWPTIPGNRFLMSPIHPGNIALRLFASVPESDVYHLFQPYPSAALPWLALKERRTRGVFAYDWDDYWMNEEFGLLRPRGLNARVTALWIRFLERYLPGRCDLLTTLSHEIASLAAVWRSPHTEIAYNGIWPEAPLPREQAREICGLRRDAIYVGMMGWSGELDWVFECMQRLRDRFPQLRIAMCGQDPARVLKRYPNVAAQLDFLGFVPDEKLRAFRHAIDLGLLPMRVSDFNKYRLPYKLTDFLAAGAPVLASDIGETSVVARQVHGVHLCAPDFDGWWTAFAAIVARLATGGFDHTVDRTRLNADFNWRSIAARMADAYRKRLSVRTSSL